MSPIRLLATRFQRVLASAICLLFMASQGYAASMKSGLVPGSENSEALRSYGTYLFIATIALVAFLLVFRGREIRSQHPKSFH